ncbi:hypothetical protein WJ970_08330 [Achromobacter xylosoxidans]
MVTVDAELGVRPGDRLTVNLPSGVSETRVVAARSAPDSPRTIPSSPWTPPS